MVLPLMDQHDNKREYQATLLADGVGMNVQQKKRKQVKMQAMKEGTWDRCMFKIVRKNRNCNLAR